MGKKAIDIFKVKELNYADRARNLDVVSKGNPPSTKYFPVYTNGGQEYIFKPLSKTKPYTTPLFSYAEVFWGYLINKYFDEKTPLCSLARCKGIENDDPHYDERGVLETSFLKPGQTYVNLFDYFNEHPEDRPDVINGYRNFCGVIYDYCDFFDTQLFSQNRNLSEQLVMRILISILIRDQNFHYENNGLIYENGQIVSLNPTVDSEFSTMFYKVDKPLSHLFKMEIYDWALSKDRQALFESLSQEEIDQQIENNLPNLWDYFVSQSELFKMVACRGLPDEIPFEHFLFILEDYLEDYFRVSTQKKNIDFIAQRFPEVLTRFQTNLETMIGELKESELVMPDNDFIGAFNSDEWEIGRARFQEYDEEKARALEAEMPLFEIEDMDMFAETLLGETINSSGLLRDTIEHYGVKNHQKVKTNLN